MAHHGLLMCIITGMVVLSPLQAILLNSNNTGGWHRLLMVAASGFIININHPD
jgi:hypothetical protein